MADNLSVTPGVGEKIPTKQLTHSGETVQGQVFMLGLDDGTTLTRIQGGQKTAAGSVPVAQSADQATRLYAKTAFGSVPSSFATILDPTATSMALALIDGYNATNADIELTFGSDTNPKMFIPAGATFDEKLMEAGLKEAQAIKYRYASVAPTTGYFLIRGVGK